MTLTRVFVPFAMGYFLSYLMRVVNAVIAPDLVRDLGLTAADLGLLTSANFLAFAVAQLPLGILLDRFGPRRTEAVLLLFAALGAFLFSIASSAPIPKYSQNHEYACPIATCPSARPSTASPGSWPTMIVSTMPIIICPTWTATTGAARRTRLVNSRFQGEEVGVGGVMAWRR